MKEFVATRNVVVTGEHGPDYIAQGDTRQYDKSPSKYLVEVGGKPVAPKPAPAAKAAKPGREAND